MGTETIALTRFVMFLFMFLCIYDELYGGVLIL